jgi:hypothetical protein
VLATILLIAGGFAWFSTERDQKERMAAAVRIDANELSSSVRYFQEIRDTKATLEQSKLARFTIETTAEGLRCQHETVKSSVHFNVRAPFGRAGEIMLVLSPETRDRILARRAKGDPGPYELLGFLVRPPAAWPAAADASPDRPWTIADRPSSISPRRTRSSAYPATRRSRSRRRGAPTSPRRAISVSSTPPPRRRLMSRAASMPASAPISVSRPTRSCR